MAGHRNEAPETSSAGGSKRRSYPGQDSFLVWLWYRVMFYALHAIVAIPFLLIYRFRAWGQEGVPRDEPVLFIGNHQSYLDPVAFGFGMHFRGFSAMARATLWQNRIVGLLLDMLRTVPVNLGRADRGAIQRCIDALAAGRTVLLYPEGTRSDTEETGPFKPGILLMARKVKPWIVPVAVHGTYQVWSRHRGRPKLSGRIGMLYGRPVPAQFLLSMPAAEASNWIRQEVERLRRELIDRLDGIPPRRDQQPNSNCKPILE